MLRRNTVVEAIGSSETYVPKEPHGVASQKTTFFIVTALTTKNLIDDRTI
jgi:hypothetical protein